MADTKIEPLSGYNVSGVTKFFHSVPHYDLSFSPVESVYNINDKSYNEALLIIASVPVVWLLLWIVIYMIYFGYFCITCRSGYEKKSKNPRCAKWLAFILCITAYLLFGASIGGSELINKGLNAANSSQNQFLNDSRQVQSQTTDLLTDAYTLRAEIQPFLNDAITASTQIDQNQRFSLHAHSSQITAALNKTIRIIRSQFQSPFFEIAMESPFEAVKEYEPWRRFGTLALGVFVMIGLTMILCAVGGRKKCFIHLCVAIVVIDVILVWCAFGLYMAISVATADICVNPSYYLNNNTDASLPNGVSLSDYYLRCPSMENPLTKSVQAVQEQLSLMDNTLLEINPQIVQAGFNPSIAAKVKGAQPKVKQLSLNLLKVLAAAECTDSHRSYVAAVRGLCETAMYGETAVTASYVLAGLILIMLVFIVHTIGRFTVSRKAYSEVECREEEYAPREQQNRSDNPLYYRFSQISTGAEGPSENTAANKPSAPPRSSPPPAVHGDFYSSYGNGGTLDSNTNMVTNDLNSDGNTFR